MKRLILGILVLALVVLLVPSLREPVQPEIDAGRVWLADRLEGPMAPVLTPYRTLRTETRVAEAASLLVRNRNLGTSAPYPSDFRQLLERHDVEPLDGWGAPLIMEQEPDSVSIISAGPDMTYDTEDDIRTKIRYRAPRRRLLRLR
jgi:hypothetical protein